MIAEIVKSGYIFKNSDHENNIKISKKTAFSNLINIDFGLVKERKSIKF